ncbi:carbamoyltransferase, partial [Streptomyces sp. SID8455]|nr:carbamoyltransferase [Streptomyces sp. SID8455]
DDAELARLTARSIADGQIIGWFQGPMEFGPRALGHRSILADPRVAGARERINALVKKRESFRPFAPAVTEGAATTLFEIEPEDVHRFAEMLFVAYVRPEYAERLPAVTHVDGSARVQSVSRGSSPLFWSLIEEFGALTGLPVLLNTSFNVA